MKLIMLDPMRLQINNSGITTLILGAVFAVIGVGGGIFAATNSGGQWWLLIVTGAFFLFGIVAIVFAKSTVVLLEKAGTSTITSKRLLGGSPNQQTFQTQQINAVVLSTVNQYTRETPTNNTATQEIQKTTSSTLSLHFLDNSSVVIAKKNRSSNTNVGGISIGTMQSAPLQKEAQQVADFLGVPLSYDGLPQPIAPTAPIPPVAVEAPQTPPSGPEQQ
jgi:hypothetical protein